MTLGLVAICVAVAVGGVVAVAAREPGLAAMGLAVALVAASMLADPVPPVALLGVRIAASLLAATLVRGAILRVPRQRTRLGWAGEALLGVAALVAGLGTAASLAQAGVTVGPPAGIDGAPNGAPGMVGMSVATVGTAALLLTLGLAPLVAGRPGPRLAVALVLVAQATLLVRTGLAGNPGELEEVSRAGLLVACAAVGAALARAAAKPPPLAGPTPASVESR